MTCVEPLLFWESLTHLEVWPKLGSMAWAEFATPFACTSGPQKKSRRPA